MSGRELPTQNGKLILEGADLTVCIEGTAPLTVRLTYEQKYRLVQFLKGYPTGGTPVHLGEHDRVLVRRHTNPLIRNIQLVDKASGQQYTVQMDGVQHVIFTNVLEWHKV